jgi:hypothetical protein
MTDITHATFANVTLSLGMLTAFDSKGPAQIGGLCQLECSRRSAWQTITSQSQSL